MKADEPSALQRLVGKDAIVDLVHRYSFVDVNVATGRPRGGR